MKRQKKEDLRFVYSCGSRSEERGGCVDITIAAIMAERFHLFPFRTQKLSFLTPKVLCGTPLGRIGHRRFSVLFDRCNSKRRSEYCSLAQSVEHRTVNPSVVSSSLTGAAISGIQKRYFCEKVRFYRAFFVSKRR